MLQFNIQIGGYGPSIDPRVSRKLPLAARQTKLLVTVWEEAPRQVDVNTLIAGNLPSILNLPVTNIREGGRYRRRFHCYRLFSRSGRRGDRR